MCLASCRPAWIGFALGLPLLAAAGLGHAESPSPVPGDGGTVAEVIDGDTLRLGDGTTVRLVGIEAPKPPPGRHDRTSALAAAAKAALGELALGKAVTLIYGGTRQDRYGRLLAHVYLADGFWLQGELLRRGLARVHVAEDNRARAAEMLALERGARTARRGLWAERAYRVRRPEETSADADSFQLVRGTVVSVAVVRGQGYLNFGPDYRTDFTVVVPARARRALCRSRHRSRGARRAPCPGARLDHAAQRPDDRADPPRRDRALGGMMIDTRRHVPRAFPSLAGLASVGRALAGLALAGLALAGLALAGLALAGCEVNPATGRASFSGLMSPAEEARIGAEQHPQVVKEFGGVYPDQALDGYVAGIGRRLTQVSEQPTMHWTVTVLNNDLVNAFSLPGGYVYVTRGLMALAENEAELAGVMAHEIGHVTARHTAERYTQAQLANLGLFGIGILTGSQGVASGGGAVAAAALQSFSRDQEFEADQLGVRYLIRAGYDPNAMASFLRKLEAESLLEARLAGRNGAPDESDIMSTHPRTSDRVERAVEAAGGRPPGTPEARVGGHDYLKRIDGLYVDGDPQNGIIKNRRFIDPALRFAFAVPPGFHLVNGEDQVLARGPNGALVLLTLDRHGGSVDAATYLQRVWAPKAGLATVERIAVNGLEGATGAVSLKTSQGLLDVRLVALKGGGGTFYRFLFLTRAADTQRLSEGLRRTTYSFTRLTPAEAAAAKPYRVGIVTVKPGDTVESLAARMPYDDLKLERFRTLNGIVAGEGVRPGQLVKLVVD